MEISVVEINPVRLAYLRYTGPYGPGIGAFWNDVFNPWRTAHGLQNRTTYGIAQDDPRQTPPEQCRYDACVEVDDRFVAEAPAATATLPGGRHATTRYRGDAGGINAAWGEFYTQALPASGLQVLPGACFERYAADFSADENTGVFECDLCVPVK